MVGVVVAVVSTGRLRMVSVEATYYIIYMNIVSYVQIYMNISYISYNIIKSYTYLNTHTYY